MRFFLFSFFPFFLFCQVPEQSVCVLVGYENNYFAHFDPSGINVFLPRHMFLEQARKSNGFGFNIDARYNRKFVNASRWTSEFGFNIASYHEKNLESSEAPPELNPPLAMYAVSPTAINSYPGILQVTIPMFYCDSYQQNVLRLQAGVNFFPIIKEKFTFSIGLNFVNEFLLSYKARGQQAIYKPGPLNTPNFWHWVIEDQYPKVYDYNAGHFIIQVQPHIDLFYAINSKICLSSRFSFFTSPAYQFDMGLSYCW